MDGKSVVKLLKKNGWEVVRIKGSHHIMKKSNMIVSVPVHGKRDLPIGTLKNISKRVGIKL